MSALKPLLCNKKNISELPPPGMSKAPPEQVEWKRDVAELVG